MRVVVQRVPRVVVVGREHVAGLGGAGKIVVSIEIPAIAALDEPAATAGTTSHVAGNGDDSAACVIGPVLR